MSTKALLTAVQTITLAHMKDFFLPRSFCLMATCDLVIAYKKAGQHTVPLVQGEGGSLLEEIGQAHEEILAPYGKKACEGLALHRLDSQTSGLVTFARTKEAYERMLGFQDSDRFIKRYLALTRPEDPQGPTGLSLTRTLSASPAPSELLGRDAGWFVRQARAGSTQQSLIGWTTRLALQLLPRASGTRSECILPGQGTP